MCLYVCCQIVILPIDRILYSKRVAYSLILNSNCCNLCFSLFFPKKISNKLDSIRVYHVCHMQYK